MSITLPKPIADFISANAHLDVDAMLKPFAPDAFVLDNGKPFEGTDQLRTLFEEEVIRVKAIFTPDTVQIKSDKIIVKGMTHGDFKGSPLQFTYCFTLQNEAIKTLTITL